MLCLTAEPTLVAISLKSKFKKVSFSTPARQSGSSLYIHISDAGQLEGSIF